MRNENWKKSELVEFTVKFNGKAVESNEMDIEELATSLLGISAVLEQANSTICGSYSDVVIKVRPFNPGSFEVDLASLFMSNGAEAFANVASILGFVSGSAIILGKNLIKVFKQSKGEKVLTKKEINGNNYEITFENCSNPMVVTDEVLKLYENEKIRSDFSRIVRPLKNKNMSDITFMSNGIEHEKILRDEVDYFKTIDNDLLEEKESIDYFLITQSNFEGKQFGWRISFGNSISDKKPSDFAVKISDNNFLQMVKTRNIKISNEGTMIKAKYRKTIQKNERLSVSWEILHVLDTFELEHHESTTNKKLSSF